MTIHICLHLNWEASEGEVGTRRQARAEPPSWPQSIGDHESVVCMALLTSLSERRGMSRLWDTVKHPEREAREMFSFSAGASYDVAFGTSVPLEGCRCPLYKVGRGVLEESILMQ